MNITVTNGAIQLDYADSSKTLYKGSVSQINVREFNMLIVSEEENINVPFAMIETINGTTPADMQEVKTIIDANFNSGGATPSLPQNQIDALNANPTLNGNNAVASIEDISNNYVPYTNATNDVDLNDKTLKSANITISTLGGNQQIAQKTTNVNGNRIAEWQDKDYEGVADITDIPDISGFLKLTGTELNNPVTGTIEMDTNLLYGDNDLVPKNYVDVTIDDALNKKFTIPKKIYKIKPIFLKYVANNALDKRTKEGWYKGISTKTINNVEIPLTASWNNSVSFTDSVYVRIGLNGTFIHTEEITLKKMYLQGIVSKSSVEGLIMYNVSIPEITINQNDVIYVGLMCKSATDKLGFVATSTKTDEWVDGWSTLSDTTDINTYSNPPVHVANGTWALSIYFSHINGTEQISYDAFAKIRDNKTFRGSYNIVLNSLFAIKPTAKVLMITHHTEDGEFKNKDLKKLINQQLEIAKFWNIPIVNLADNLGWVNKDNVNTLIANVPDMIHPASNSSLTSIQDIKRLIIPVITPLLGNWTGKKIAWYGTSIPAGYPLFTTASKYPDQIALDLGATINNKALSSSNMRAFKVDGNGVQFPFIDITVSSNYKKDMLDLIGTVDEPDIFVFDFGINDFYRDRTDF